MATFRLEGQREAAVGPRPRVRSLAAYLEQKQLRLECSWETERERGEKCPSFSLPLPSPLPQVSATVQILPDVP